MSYLTNQYHFCLTSKIATNHLFFPWKTIATFVLTSAATVLNPTFTHLSLSNKTCNTLFAALPAKLINFIQSVQIYVARLILHKWLHRKISPLLFDLHCFLGTDQIAFKNTAHHLQSNSFHRTVFLSLPNRI